MTATVLIIEDEANIRMFVAANLEARGYQVLEAGTGTDGLTLLRQHQPQVVILDMRLPDMEGWDILDTMAGDDSMKTIPVIMMSASTNGAVANTKTYTNLVERLTKPASVQDLVETVKRVVEQA
jgi:two-component system, OmpR family, KDP operon response regulator KdpE